MESAIKVLLPFLSTPKNYEDILVKLASFAFYETYLITLLLRTNSKFDAFLGSVESWGSLKRALSTIPHHEALNLTGIAIGILVAFLTHGFQLHDRISDLLGIRRRFDEDHILVPLATGAGVEVDEKKKARIAANRDRLMRETFYKYTSSRALDPLVDKHDIEHALNAWSWFWVYVEGAVYFGIAMLLAWLLDSCDIATVFGVATIALLLLALVQRARLARYARPQVQEILRDEVASKAIKAAFDAL